MLSAADTKRYYRQSINTFEKLLSISPQTTTLDPNLQLQVRVRMATACQRLGDFRRAIDLFAVVLSQREKMLNVQVDAARALQQWAASGAPAAYLKAINGDRPDGKTGRNIIWGWGRLASVVGNSDLLARYPQYRETYHEARYNIAYCRFQYALARNSEQQRQELLERAKRDILITYRLYPLLGDAQRRQQYEALLKLIQKRLGEKAVGLDALEGG
jgi:Tfp pilus assembly protein PilF